jgi:hypothetical protein
MKTSQFDVYTIKLELSLSSLVRIANEHETSFIKTHTKS